MEHKFHDDHDRRAHRFLHILDSDDHPHPPHAQNGGSFIFEGQSSDIFRDIVDQLMFRDIVDQLMFLDIVDQFVFQSNIRLFMAHDNRPNKEDLYHDTSNSHIQDDIFELHNPSADHHMDAHNDRRIWRQALNSNLVLFDNLEPRHLFNPFLFLQ